MFLKKGDMTMWFEKEGGIEAARKVGFDQEFLHMLYMLGNPKKYLENKINEWLKVNKKVNGNKVARALSILAKSEYRDIRWSVAGNSDTPKNTLSILAKDEESAVRGGVAGNSNTPRKVLEMLTEDEDWSVRCNAIMNSSTPRRILKILVKDKNEDVRRVAKEGLCMS